MKHSARCLALLLALSIVACGDKNGGSTVDTELDNDAPADLIETMDPTAEDTVHDPEADADAILDTAEVPDTLEDERTDTTEDVVVDPDAFDVVEEDLVDEDIPTDLGTEEPPCTGPPVLTLSDSRISNALERSINPSITWTGSEFGVAWEDYRTYFYQIYFARISASGVKIGADVRITSTTEYATSADIVWTGSEYGVSWTDSRYAGNREIFMARISSTGSKIGADRRITNDPDNSRGSSITWSGSEFGVAWDDDRDWGDQEIYFARISSTGSKIGGDVRITNSTGRSTYPAIEWTGSEYGIIWKDERTAPGQVYFTRVSPAGSKIGSDVVVSSSPELIYEPALGWTGSEFGACWRDTRDWNREIYCCRFSPDGTKIGSDIRITNDVSVSEEPTIAWAGVEYGISWIDERDGDREVYFARLSSAGVKIGADTRVTSYIGTAYHTDSIWTGSALGLSWSDGRYADRGEILFGLFDYCP
jgi:hypothetical protein